MGQLEELGLLANGIRRTRECAQRSCIVTERHQARNLTLAAPLAGGSPQAIRRPPHAARRTPARVRVPLGVRPPRRPSARPAPFHYPFAPSAEPRPGRARRPSARGAMGNKRKGRGAKRRTAARLCGEAGAGDAGGVGGTAADGPPAR